MNTSSHLGARHTLIGLMPLVFYAFPAEAAPSFTSQPSVVTENIGPNSAGFKEIHRLNLGVNVSDPLGVPGNIVSVEAIAQTLVNLTTTCRFWTSVQSLKVSITSFLLTVDK